MSAQTLLPPDQLLAVLVKHLVDFPDLVRVHCVTDAGVVTFAIHVDERDIGKVLGKSGVYAEALRTLFRAIYGKDGQGLHLQVVVPRPRRR